MGIELLPFNIHVQCEFSEETMRLHDGAQLAADVTLSGTPLALFGVSIEKAARQKYFKEEIKLTGDAQLAQEVSALFDELDIDWEDHLAQWLGDHNAYQLSKAKNKMATWVQSAKESLVFSITDYIHEEAKWLPKRELLQEFFSDVDLLRAEVDRLAATVTAFATRLAQEEDECN